MGGSRAQALGDRDAVAGASGEGLDGGEKRKGDRGEERRGGRERMEEEFGVSVWLRVGLYNKRAALQVASHVGPLAWTSSAYFSGEAKGEERVPPPLY